MSHAPVHAGRGARAARRGPRTPRAEVAEAISHYPVKRSAMLPRAVDRAARRGAGCRRRRCAWSARTLELRRVRGVRHRDVLHHVQPAAGRPAPPPGLHDAVVLAHGRGPAVPAPRAASSASGHGETTPRRALHAAPRRVPGRVRRRTVHAGRTSTTTRTSTRRRSTRCWRRSSEPRTAAVQGHRHARAWPRSRPTAGGGGYAGARRDARQEDARRVHRDREGLGPARPRRRGLPGRAQVELRAQEQHRSRKYIVCNADESRAGHVQGPRADGEEPAPADRGHDPRRATRSARNVGYIYLRGEFEYIQRILDRAIAEARAAGLLGDERRRQRVTRSSSTRTSAPAPTSAARRRRCCRRSRATAASRASSRRSRRSRACTPARRW